MPLKKRFGRRRFKRGKKSSGWRSMKLGSLASKAMSGVRFLKSIVNTEKHFFDTTTATNLVAAGTIITTDNMVQGDAYNNRNGNSCLAKSILVNFILNAGSAVANTPPFFPNIVRILLVLDKENRAASPALTDILETGSIDSPINHTNGKRFYICRDKRYMINDQYPRITPKIFCKLRHHVKYNDTNGGTSADFRENHIYLVVVAQNAAGTVPPSFNAYTRFRYIDN